MNKRHVIIGSDVAGSRLKKEVKKYLDGQGYCLDDHKTRTDYPDTAFEVCTNVLRTGYTGILISGPGIDMSVAANKISGIRAAICMNENCARATRNDNDSNVLILPSLYVNDELAKHITDIFLTTPFSYAERHVRRIGKIEKLRQQV